ncbi:hypothetical protein MPTK1_8g10220 [Marchantia polymorpha subsp. ruderalis]|uniref:Uncharacterized protein n=1 Tax=Marchantia polymorpha TaxID=3197 RepID=A0A2R6XMW5_MARPO|nr:hypothetical protein MARPO_0008s0200 [Marchantia polymorpha]BBN19383.1 hypothetical protein Mp_8g10220 [Marchantia polymorpha subsp. ruderalis]|eukprot:PTQ47449.1 hypothetical protein MARPO_0008s0200 [Marchantia polymorpha]
MSLKGKELKRIVEDASSLCSTWTIFGSLVSGRNLPGAQSWFRWIMSAAAVSSRTHDPTIINLLTAHQCLIGRSLGHHFRCMHKFLHRPRGPRF